MSTVIQSGTVYLYSPANPVNPNPVDAQTLILAQQGTASTLDEAVATFFDQGSLIVTKTISGNGAPFHGVITITVVCNGVTLDPFIIPVGTVTNVSQTYGPLQTPQVCTVTETGDGASPPGVTVVVTGSGQTVTVPQNTDPNDSETATIGDVYTAEPGSLVGPQGLPGRRGRPAGPGHHHHRLRTGLPDHGHHPRRPDRALRQPHRHPRRRRVCTVTRVGWATSPAPSRHCASNRPRR